MVVLDIVISQNPVKGKVSNACYLISVCSHMDHWAVCVSLVLIQALEIASVRNRMFSLLKGQIANFGSLNLFLFIWCFPKFLYTLLCGSFPCWFWLT